MPVSSPWWAPDRHADRRPFLLSRARIAAALRRWFADNGFIEVETAALQVSPGNETHLHAFATRLVGPEGRARDLYLRTSPEFACKALLAAGERKIFDFARVFRNRERGPLHHPEFTMLEWYRVGEPYQVLMQDCADLLAVAAKVAGTTTLSFRGQSVDAFAAPERASVVEAFLRDAGVDLLASMPDGRPDRDLLAAQARASGVHISEDDSWGDMFSRILVERIEPRLGLGHASILYEYPAALSALARPSADPRLAERFELYACGVELANGFGELTDAAEQRRRLEGQMAEKERIYGERYPVDEDFLAALGQMPQASGIALGFDRLVMLATGATHIEQVLWSPVAEIS
jgi:elongation factor P--(R)-beta-lysine ligase